MKNHIASVHANEKPFKCEICKSSFTLKHNLNQHVAKVHEKRSKNQCKTCDRIFQNRDDLKLHMKEVHDDTISKPQSPGILWTQNPDCKILKAKTKETTTFERDSCDKKNCY